MTPLVILSACVAGTLFAAAASRAAEELSAGFRDDPGRTRARGPAAPTLLATIGHLAEVGRGVAGLPTDQWRLQRRHRPSLDRHPYEQFSLGQPLQSPAGIGQFAVPPVGGDLAVAEKPNLLD